MLSHLVYVSKRSSTCTEEELNKILDSCRRNNAGIDITGVLLYSDNKFVQYLEGNQAEITGLYDKIKDDQRHSGAVMVTLGPIKERMFPSWQMGAQQFNESRIEFKTDMTPNDQKEFKEILQGKEKEGTRALKIMKKFFA